MKKYILASDYDGTLRQGDAVDAQTIEAIKKFQAEGHLFGVATGRDYAYGFEVFRELNTFPFDFVIMGNGSSACDKDGNIIFAEYIKGDTPLGKSTLVQELVKRCLELTSDNCGVSLEKCRFNFNSAYPEGGKGNGIEYSPLSVLENVGHIVSATARCETPEQAIQVTEILRKEFGEYLNPIRNWHCIDIAPIGVDKATGVERLAECMGVHHNCVWTAGDGNNDVDMIEKFHGCAMSKGADDLREVAEYVCDNVADVIKTILEK